MNYHLRPGKAPNTFIGEYWAPDGFGLNIRFWRYTIDSRPDWYDAVYAFVSFRSTGLVSTPMLEYVGKAGRTRDRLATHDRVDSARHRGATEVWIPAPMPVDRVSYHEIERRLIRTYDPPMNVQHPLPFLGSLGLVGHPMPTPKQSY